MSAGLADSPTAPTAPDPATRPDLTTPLGPLTLKNPILSASGTFGYGPEIERFFDPGCLGAIVGKSITLAPRLGNASPRMAETPSGMLNAIGLQNPGLDRYLAEILPPMRSYGAPILVNVAGSCEDDYVAIAERLTGVAGVAGLELNLSCPNVRHGGIRFSTSAQAAERLCRRVREATPLPLFAKLTPNVTDIGEVAKGCEAGGADGITAINTLVGMAVDWRARRSRLATMAAGLSGPAIKPVALHMVHRVYESVSIPVIGVGGVRTAEDALEMMCVGASAVQIGTATFVDPLTIPRVIARLADLLAREGIGRSRDLVGSVQLR